MLDLLPPKEWPNPGGRWRVVDYDELADYRRGMRNLIPEVVESFDGEEIARRFLFRVNNPEWSGPC